MYKIVADSSCDMNDFPGIPARGLCSYYAERGGIILGCEQ